jgi:hypothetical protein
MSSLSVPPGTKISARVGATVGRLGGMMKPRDRGTIPLDRFEHLENIRFTPSWILACRGGETEMASGMDLMDGIFDCGDGGVVAVPAPAPVFVGGEIADSPTANTVQFTSVHATYNAYTAVGTGNKVTAITDSDDATRIKPASAATANANNQLFHFTAPVVDDDDVISELLLHIVPHQTLTAAEVTFITKAVMDGIFTGGGWKTRGYSGCTAGVEIALDIPRPGGGQWYGVDLKNATTAFGVRIGYSGTVPEIRKMWFTYVVGA